MAYQDNIHSRAIGNHWHGSMVVMVMSNCSGVHPASQAVGLCRAQRMRIQISSRTQSKNTTMHGRNGLTGPKRGEILQLRPFQEAVLTSVCVSDGCHRPERLAAQPQERSLCRSTHGSPPLHWSDQAA